MDNCPASMDIALLERYTQQLEDTARDIERTKTLPKRLRETLHLYLTHICGYKSRKYNSVSKQINNVRTNVIVQQSCITGAQKIIDNTEIMCKQYIKIIDGLIKYTKRRINKLKKETKNKQNVL